MKARLETFPGMLAAISAVLMAIPARGGEDELAAKHAPVERLERVPPPASEQSRQAIQSLPGFQVELVAAEPLLLSPIAIDFDEDGRMYCSDCHQLENVGRRLGAHLHAIGDRGLVRHTTRRRRGPRFNAEGAAYALR